MNDDGNNDGDGGEEGPLAIESLDHYIRRYGLPDANRAEDRPGEFNGLNRHEANERVRAEEAYRDRIIESHQEARPHEERTGNNEGTTTRTTTTTMTILLVLDGRSAHHPVPAPPLVASCETVRRMVASRWRRRVAVATNKSSDDEGGTAAAGDEDDPRTAADAASRAEEEEEAEEKTSVDSADDAGAGGANTMELSLVEFDAGAVMQFVDVIVSLHGQGPTRHDRKESPPEANDERSDASSRKRRMGDGTDEAADARAVLTLVTDGGKISDGHVVECLRIAHYLQCRAVVDALASVLERSVDSRNCMALCSLADALGLASLFESSVNHVIGRLDALRGGSTEEGEGGGGGTGSSPSVGCGDDDDEAKRDDEMGEMWASLPHELRSRVLTMRNVMRSSVIGRGSRVSGLFFSSGNEFLAIFRETLADRRERLAEARERREEVIRERTEQWSAMAERRRGGRWFDSSPAAREGFVHGADVKYALEKIEDTSRRLATLESFYEEQKIIFEGGGLTGEVRL